MKKCSLRKGLVRQACEMLIKFRGNACLKGKTLKTLTSHTAHLNTKLLLTRLNAASHAQCAVYANLGAQWRWRQLRGSSNKERGAVAGLCGRSAVSIVTLRYDLQCNAGIACKLANVRELSRTKNRIDHREKLLYSYCKRKRIDWHLQWLSIWTSIWERTGT